MGKKVRVVGRDEKKLTPFVSRGAEAFAADVLDKEALCRAFDGAEAVYSLTPPNLTSSNLRAYQDQVIDTVASALETTGVKYAVTLSSFGADKPDKTGPVAGLHYMETRFAKISGLNALHLRAGYFMENTLPQVEILQQFGMMAGPVNGDLKLPMIATRDIGCAPAAEFYGPANARAAGAAGYFLQRGGARRRCGHWAACASVYSASCRTGDHGDGSDGDIEKRGQPDL